MGEVERHEPDIVNELAFHQRMAIKHTGEGDMHLTMGLNEYMQAGDHLREVKALMEPEDFRAWVESPSGYNRSLRTVNRYIRVASNRELLESRVSQPSSLNEALDLLALPKPAIEDAEVQEPRRRGDAASLREERRKLRAERDAIARGIERIGHERRQLEDERGAIIEEVEGHFASEMAELKAKYGEVEEPRFAHIPPEVWEEKIRNAKSQRVMNVTKHLTEFYSWPDWMQHYFHDEAAEAIMDMERRDDFIEGWKFIINWMTRVLDEVEDMGRP